VDVDLHVLADHLEQLAAEQRQEIRAAALTALLRDDDPQPFLGERRRRRAAAEECEPTIHDHPLKIRVKKPFFGSSTKRSATSSPRSRETASSYARATTLCSFRITGVPAFDAASTSCDSGITPITSTPKISFTSATLIISPSATRRG